MNNELGGSKQGNQGSVSESVPRLSDDRLYRALVSRRRRRLLYLLLEEAECSIDEAATLLTGWGATETSEMATADEYGQAVVSLKHVHLPLLEEADLIGYDRRSETIGIESLDPVVEDLIRRSVESEPR